MSLEHVTGNRHPLVALAAAIVAVLAAVSTLFAHHRSIEALAAKNDAIVVQTQAYDLYNFYQARRTRYSIYSGLLAAGVASTPENRKALAATAQSEQTASLQTLEKAHSLDAVVTEEQARSETILGSFETLEISTALFEVAIVLISISALAQTRALLLVAGAAAVAGIAFLIFGILRAAW